MARRALHDINFWAEHLSRQQASGLSVREYCERERLQTHNFHYGRKRVLAMESRVPSPSVKQQTRGRAATTGQLRNSTQVRDATKSRHEASTSAIAPPASAIMQGPVVVIQFGEASIHVPADLTETIEAVLKMALRLNNTDYQATTAAGPFRSVIVR